MTQSPPIELRHLRHFVALAEELHFGRAAARVGIAQPPFSQSIARLESLIDAQLFDRRRAGPERLRLTDAGRVLVERARYVIADVSDALETARATARGDAGTLRVGFVASLANGRLPLLLAAFATEFPNIVLSLSEMTTEPMLDRLGGREIDLGLGRELLASPVVHVQPLFQERLSMVAASGCGLVSQGLVTATDLVDQPFILPPSAAGNAWRRHVLELCARSGFVPNVRQEATEWTTILGLVRAGFGISIVPASTLSRGAEVETVDFAAASEWTTTVSACWLADSRSPSRDRMVSALITGWSADARQGRGGLP